VVKEGWRKVKTRTEIEAKALSCNEQESVWLMQWGEDNEASRSGATALGSFTLTMEAKEHHPTHLGGFKGLPQLRDGEGVDEAGPHLPPVWVCSGLAQQGGQGAGVQHLQRVCARACVRVRVCVRVCVCGVRVCVRASVCVEGRGGATLPQQADRQPPRLAPWGGRWECICAHTHARTLVHRSTHTHARKRACQACFHTRRGSCSHTRPPRACRVERACTQARTYARERLHAACSTQLRPRGTVCRDPNPQKVICPRTLTQALLREPHATQHTQGHHSGLLEHKCQGLARSVRGKPRPPHSLLN